ncbi:MAG: 3-isopropylmalate dehydratase small subunit, partial [Amylibacter sp.]|nr:3-isopropylmalate dehydratase small subunit [Amylibacter sp.]
NSGQQRPEFILNKAPWKQATILVVGDNFGCGSSREHAVWGMRQLGIEACIGTTFAGIFYDNARKNGLALPIVSSETRDKLLEFAKNSSGEKISIELDKKTITAGDILVPFVMDEATQASLIRGRDDTLDTLKYTSAIQNFETKLNDRMRVNVIK